MADPSAYTAVAAVLKALAAEPRDQTAVPFPTGGHIKLPGPDCLEKQALERELAALSLRVQQLEARANSAGATTLPEAGDSLFGQDVGSSASSTAGRTSPRMTHAMSTGQNSVSDDESVKMDEALAGLREHVHDQSKLLDTQRQELVDVNTQLLEQKQLQEETLAMIELRRVPTLERELYKHQKANEAFQKALREIGEIVTAVARGDLSKKVRMNTVEMDPEITTFKRTINTMMDQLQVFSSEVSRVAREVGTEGILGGQAQIEGVDGTWNELTYNGESIGRSRRRSLARPCSTGC